MAKELGKIAPKYGTRHKSNNMKYFNRYTVKLQVEYPFDLSALLPVYELVWQIGNPDRGRQPNC